MKCGLQEQNSRLFEQISLTLEVSAGKTKKDAQNILVELQRLQLEHQVLKTEKDDIQVSYETLSVEKDQLQSRIAELETEKAATEEREKQYQIQVATLEEQNTSLIASLKDAIEQKIDFQPLKEHVLTQRRKIHHLQMCVEEEIFNILQIDNRLEEIFDTMSYFQIYLKRL